MQRRAVGRGEPVGNPRAAVSGGPQVAVVRDREHGVPRVDEGTEVRSGALVDGDVVYVHAARTVRALDARSGLELWRFPPREIPLSRTHDPAVRHAPADRPVHAVVPAGDLLLVVLGDPPSTGSYEVQGTVWGEDNIVEYPRTHLVALDKASGELR